MVKPILTTTVTVAVHREGSNPVHGEETTSISATDEGSGPFLLVSQMGEDADLKVLRFDPDELDTLARVGKELIERFCDG